MKITRRLVLLLLVLLLMFTAACSENGADRSAEKVTSRGSAVDEQTESPLLWRATDKDGESIYFFGTIHAGDKQSKSVLKRLEPILDECDALAVEFDVVAYSKDLKAQKNGLMDFVYADGTTLEDHISDELGIVIGSSKWFLKELQTMSIMNI